MVSGTTDSQASGRAHGGDTAGRAVVVLGASNVARGWSSLVETIGRLDTAPTDIFSAAGHGRSYGRRSRALARELPGVVECGLWPALDTYQGKVTAALVTDIGNDLLYEQSVDEIEHWVATCLDRLRAHTDRIAMTCLPEVSPQTIGRWRFLFFRTLLVPTCRLNLDEVARRAAALNRALVRLAERSGVELVRHDPVWYGLDPIHVVRRARHTAWARMLSPVWGDSAVVPTRGNGQRKGPRTGPTMARRRGRPRAALRWMFGREQRTSQPSALLGDGGAVSWY